MMPLLTTPLRQQRLALVGQLLWATVQKLRLLQQQEQVWRPEVGRN